MSKVKESNECLIDWFDLLNGAINNLYLVYLYQVKKLTFSDILGQLKDDLIGKDSYRGVSLSYAWLANQLGHFTLGLLLAVIFFHATPYQRFDLAAYFSGLIWTIFEIYNFLGPLLLKKNSAKVKLNQQSQYTFKPKWLNIFFDTFTDVCFFWLGAFSFYNYFDESFSMHWILVLLGIYLAIAFCYWYPVKIFLQQARFPWQTRLSQWQHLLHPQNIKQVEQFIKDNNLPTHVIIYGGANKGKTTLAIGMATERAFLWKTCAYVPFAKFLSDVKSVPNQIPGPSFWDWKSSDTLIIDDVNPSDPAGYEFMNTAQIDSQIAEVKDILWQKNVIWIIGAGDLMAWQHYLKINPNEKRELLILSL